MVLNAMIFLLCTSIGTAQAGLLGFYDLDGNGLEATGTGPNLTEPAGVVNYVAGLDGQAASFDGTGNSWLRAAINSSGHVNPTFSWGAWVKLNDPAAWNIFLSNDNGGWDRFSQVRNGFWSVSRGGVQNSPYAANSDWTFIAHTFDGTTQHLYVDDNLAFDFADGLNTSHSFIDIGRNANSAFPLNGLMDGVFFFDDMLTASEVEEIRLGGAGGGGGLGVAGVSVPEPGTLALLALGLLGVGVAKKRRTH